MLVIFLLFLVAMPFEVQTTWASFFASLSYEWLDAQTDAQTTDNWDSLKNRLVDIKHAVENGHLDSVKLLHKKNIDINEKYEEGKTALMLAAEFRRKNIVEFLLANNVDIDIQDDSGWIALKYATERKNGFAGPLTDEQLAIHNKREANKAEIIKLLKEAHQKEIFETLKKMFSESEEEFQHLRGHDLEAIPKIIADYTSDLLLIEESN